VGGLPATEHGRLPVHIDFDAGFLSCHGGLLLLREVDRTTGFFGRVASCFDDHRDARYVEHPLPQLLGQRLLAIAMGYPDINDHDTLRDDPMFALAVGQLDLFGQTRRHSADQGHALAAHATLHRLENAPDSLSVDRRDLKILHRPDALENLLIDEFLDSYDHPPASIVLDLDPTCDEVHGEQEGRHFSAFYKHYCFLPLYIFCGTHLVASHLGLASEDAGATALPVLKRVVTHAVCRFFIRLNEG
jgi:hypothetical protein